MFHDLFSWLANKAKPVAQQGISEITHNSFWSIRTILVVAFIAYLLYLNHLLLTPDNVALVAKLIAVFLLCNTLTKLGTIAANGWIKVAAIKEFSKDNHLDANEADIIGDRNNGQPAISDPTFPSQTP